MAVYREGERERERREGLEYRAVDSCLVARRCAACQLQATTMSESVCVKEKEGDEEETAGFMLSILCRRSACSQYSDLQQKAGAKRGHWPRVERVLFSLWGIKSEVCEFC